MLANCELVLLRRVRPMLYKRTGMARTILWLPFSVRNIKSSSSEKRLLFKSELGPSEFFYLKIDRVLSSHQLDGGPDQLRSNLLQILWSTDLSFWVKHQIIIPIKSTVEFLN